MGTRSSLLLVAAQLACASVALPAELAPASFAAHVTDFETEIHRLAAVDERHPRAFATRLDFAAFLADNSKGDCANRLGRAEEQLRLVESNPVAPVALANAAARIAAVHYGIEYARAGCSTDPAARKTALGAAIEAAQRSAAAYEDLFDYENLAAMRFDVAAAYHELGEDKEAIRLLEGVLDLDRRYGLKSDAADNFKVLSRWRGREASRKDVTEYLKSFPDRSVTLNFNWSAFQAQQTRRVESWNVLGDRVVKTVVNLPIELRVQEEPADLLLTSRIGTVTSSCDADPTVNDAVQRMMVVTARALSVPSSAVISRAGKFVEARDVEATAAASSKELDAIVGSLGRAEAPAQAAIRALVDEAIRPILTKEAIAATVREEHTFETSMWAGSTLQQNEWREMSGAVSMFGTSQGKLQTKLQVALVRFLPCADGAAEDSCVELLLEASPEQPAIGALAEELSAKGLGQLDYSAMTRARVVLDPRTLQTYLQDIRRSAYVTMSKGGQREATIGAIHELTVTRYQPVP